MKCKRCNTNEAEYCETCLTGERIKEKKVFKKRIWARAKRKCEICNFEDDRCLTIHHIDKKLHPFDVKWAILLCLNCHLCKVHNRLNKTDKMLFVIDLEGNECVVTERIMRELTAEKREYKVVKSFDKDVNGIK